MQSLNSKNKCDVQISKRLSWILRHGALEEGLNISEEGFILVSDILKCKHFEAVLIEDIQRIVSRNDKQRFSLRKNGAGLLEIRANQGHSINNVAKLELFPITNSEEVERVIHGTYYKYWDSIKREGLFRGKRNHIHFSEHLPGDKVISGIRKSAEIHIYIDLIKCLSDGLLFFKSSNNVILCSGDERGYIKPKYFLKVCRSICEVCNVVLPEPAQKDHIVGKKHQLLLHKLKLKETKEQCGVFVKGFSISTNFDELKQFLSSYGEIVDSFRGDNNAFAIIQFKEPVSVENLLKEKLEFKGRKLSISRRVVKTHEVRSDDIEKYQKTENLAEINECLKIIPNFDEQIIELTKRLQPNWPDMVRKYEQLCFDLRSILLESFPNCIVYPFGSTITRLSFTSSDVDVYVKVVATNISLPSSDNTLKAVTYVRKAKKLLDKYPNFSQVYAIPKAKTPIVKCVHNPTMISCDFNFKSMLGVCNTSLIQYYLSLDDRLSFLMITIKYWAKIHDLTGIRARFSNYALIMLFIFYLQQGRYLIPSVRELQQAPHALCVQDGWNGGFSKLSEFRNNLLNTFSTSEILLGFFEYYANFDYCLNVICPYLGRTVLKTDFIKPECLSNEFELYKKNLNHYVPLRIDSAICVQDPFEQNHNVISCVCPKVLEEFVLLCKNAVSILKNPIDKCTLYKLFTEQPLKPSAVGDTNNFKFSFAMGSNCLLHLNHIAEINSGDELDSDEKAFKLRTAWYGVVNEFILKFLTKIMKFSVSLQPINCEKKTLKLNEQTDVHDTDVVDSVALLCTGIYNLWETRKSISKDLIIDNKVEFMEKQIFISDYVSSFYKDLKLSDVIIEFELNTYAKTNPVEMHFVVININSKQSVFTTFTRFLGFLVNFVLITTFHVNIIVYINTQSVDLILIRLHYVRVFSLMCIYSPPELNFHDEEEEDVPSDFFDDFLSNDFMDGLDVVDTWDDEVEHTRNEKPSDKDTNKAKKRRLSRSRSPIRPRSRDLRGRSPRSSKFKSRRSRERMYADRQKRRTSIARNKSQEDLSVDHRRDPEKTRRDIQKDKDKCSKHQEDKLISEKLKVVETGLVPPGTEMDADLDTLKPKPNQDVKERKTSRRRTPVKYISPKRDRSSDRRRHYRRSRSSYRNRSRSRSLRLSRRLSSERNQYLEKKKTSSRDIIGMKGTEFRRKSPSSDREMWMRHKEKRVTVADFLGDQQHPNAGMNNFNFNANKYYNPIQERINEPPQLYMNPAAPLPVPAPIPISIPNQYFPSVSGGSEQNYDQSFFIGQQFCEVYPTATVPYQAAPYVECAPNSNVLTVPIVECNQPLPTANPIKNVHSMKDDAEKEKETIHRLFEDKKITLSDFLSVSVKHADPSTPINVQKKIKVISLCQDAIKSLTGTSHLNGRFFLQKVQRGPDKLTESKFQSPLKKTPFVRFNFTTAIKTGGGEQPSILQIYLNKLLASLGLLEDSLPVIVRPQEEISSPKDTQTAVQASPTKWQTSSNKGGDSATEISPKKAKMCQTDFVKCLICEIRKSRTFVDKETQYEAKYCTSSTQVTEDDFARAGVKPIFRDTLKNQSLAHLTPAQLMRQTEPKQASNFTHSRGLSDISPEKFGNYRGDNPTSDYSRIGPLFETRPANQFEMRPSFVNNRLNIYENRNNNSMNMNNASVRGNAPMRASDFFDGRQNFGNNHPEIQQQFPIQQQQQLNKRTLLPNPNFNRNF
ncbi:hypothetical protein FQR65_LT04894 [Abscondita terminalis]|nr:hypothetical protein FQR65_LT04894 [Abscondita terminalis]